jgi:hypothetical protein
VVDCAELIGDRYFAAEGFCRAWELQGLADAGVGMIVHGLSGNFASVTGPNDEYLDQIAKLFEGTAAIGYSDHLAFTGTGEHALGHLAPNRFDDELLELAAGHIDRVGRRTGRRVCLENLATTTMMSGSTYTPEEFYLKLLEVSPGWDCLLDLTNIWINAQNRPLDVYGFLDELPADRVRFIHLAGGRRIGDELVDTHSNQVHPEVFPLLEYLLTKATPDVILIERDSNWEGAEAEVRSDLGRVREMLRHTVPLAI